MSHPESPDSALTPVPSPTRGEGGQKWTTTLLREIRDDSCRPSLFWRLLAVFTMVLAVAMCYNGDRKALWFGKGGGNEGD